MIAVIQCAARKAKDAGHLITTGGKPVLFVADPAIAPNDDGVRYARPDDPANNSSTWRDELIRYNESGSNPLGLLPAWQLYSHPAFERLAKNTGLDRLYILSAGWGLVPASFLLPNYDITFSAAAPHFKRRRRKDRYADFRLLHKSSTESVAFFGGKDYVPLFVQLTGTYRGRRTVIYRSARAPDAPGCTLQRFETTTRTNWHYECVSAFVNGQIAVTSQRG